MEITSVKIHKVAEKENSRLGAFAEVVIDDAIAIHGIRVLHGDNGLFLGMPSDKTPHGFKDMVHPISQEVRTAFEKAIFDAYENATDADEASEE